MDKRKIIAFGTNSFVISLPKSWIESNNLKKGDVVDLTFDQTDITISSSEKEEVIEEIEINVDKDHNLVRTELVTAYLQGYDSIELFGKTLNKIITEIRDAIRLLPGLEIMQLTSDRMKLKNLLNEKNVSIKEIVSRTNFMVKSMMQECVDSFAKDIHEAISERDKEVNRMVFLSFRVITKALKNPLFGKEIGLNSLEAMVKWKIMLRLEKIGDQLKRIARSMESLSLKDKDTKEAKRILGLLQKDYLGVMDSYEKKNKGILLKIATYSKSNTISELKNMTEKTKSPMMLVVIENFKNMSSSIEHIAQSALREM